MRTARRTYLLGILLTVALHGTGQLVRIQERGIWLERIDARDLRENLTEVAGQGSEVPGLDLERTGRPRHIIGDEARYADRLFEDSLWRTLKASQDTMVPGAAVHWVRYHLLLDTGMRKVPLTLNVQLSVPFELYLNGRSILRSAPSPTTMLDRSPVIDTVPRTSLPVEFQCDDRPEVLALRIETPPGRSLSSVGLHVSLHAPDSTYQVQRGMVNFGVFIGINCVILLLSLVIWSFDRGDRSWLLLALLSLVSAMGTLAELGGDMGTLGLSPGMSRNLDLLDLILTPWPMYLLIMVLGTMRGDMRRSRARLYTIGVLVVTLIAILIAVGDILGITDTKDGFMLLKDSPVLIFLMIVLAILFGGIVAWFAIDVVRLGVQLLRSKGYARWIGAGALASSLLTLVLKISSEMTGAGLSSWLKVIGEYSSYVAVPLSVAVYLAIRSADHNRLVARQRDDLDREVHERTAELREERDRSDRLLLNILPEEVARELKDTGAAEARHFDTATILFTDFKGFTQASEKLTPQELVEELNICFKAFDGIIGGKGIEKIKTIGDAYMCAGGLPDPTTSSPADVVFAGLDMLAFMAVRKQQRDAKGLPAFEMRVGIHTGPVVAGIVGVKKFQYDIWGDTVNTASRMESSGEVGRLNVSGATFALMKDTPGLRFHPRGRVHAKGKGELEMYFVERA